MENTVNEPNTQLMLVLIHGDRENEIKEDQKIVGRRLLNLYRNFDIKNVKISKKNDILK